jgi:hypothetical protein
MMNEADWWASADPQPMLAWIDYRLSARKKRLFAVACCRHIWDQMSDIRSQGAVDVAERYADGAASSHELEAAHEAAFTVYQNAFTVRESAAMAAVSAADNSATYAARMAFVYARHAGGRQQGDLLRHLVGNPFHSVAIDPDWLRWNGGIIAALAASIYEARLSQEMLLLGDALEDAGCTDPSVLDHCRSGGRHPRGCWLLDLLLAKE